MSAKSKPANTPTQPIPISGQIIPLPHGRGSMALRITCLRAAPVRKRTKLHSLTVAAPQNQESCAREPHGRDATEFFTAKEMF
jgi:hypothetical protein